MPGLRIYRPARRGLYTPRGILQQAFPEGSVPHPPLPHPPTPSVRVHRVTTAHGVRQDPFYWLRDDTRSDPEVLAHLRAETTYAEEMLRPAQPLIEQLYGEIVGRIKQD